MKKGRGAFEALFTDSDDDDEEEERDIDEASVVKNAASVPLTKNAEERKSQKRVNHSKKKSLDKRRRSFEDEEVSILTYNVLADHLCKPAWFPYRSKAELDWRSRKEVIKSTILNIDASIVCLQEVQIFTGPEHLRGNDHHLSWFDEWLRSEGEYTGCFGARSNAHGKPQPGIQIGNLLYWKKELFEPVLVESSVSLLQTLANHLKGDKELKGIFCGSGSRGTVASIVALRCLASGRIIVVANTHLPAPRSDGDGSSKLEQLLHACALLHEVAGFVSRVNDGVDAVFVCGDMNSLPNNEVVELFRRGRLSRQKLLRLMRSAGRHRAPFVDFENGSIRVPNFILRSRSSQSSNEIEPNDFMTNAIKLGMSDTEVGFTNLTDNFKGWLDHIFLMCAPGVIRRVEANDPSVGITEDCFLPHPVSGHGSDHLPLVCHLTIAARSHRGEMSRECVRGPHAISDSEGMEDEDALQFQLVDTDIACDQVLDELTSTNEKSMFAVDLQGAALSREGPISVIQIKLLNLEGGKTFVFDALALWRKAKVIAPKLKALLEDPAILKVFYDVRFDSDALFHQYNVTLRGVLDLQVLQQGVRLAKGEELPVRTQSWVPHLATLSRVFSTQRNASEAGKLKRPAPFGKTESAEWLSRPLFPLAIEFAACQIGMIEAVFHSLRSSKELNLEILELIEQHCYRALEDFRSRKDPVLPERDKTETMEELSIRATWERRGDPEDRMRLLELWKRNNVFIGLTNE